MLERLQKLISRAGVASRRHAEQLIVSGQVTVNGHTVTELGSKADPETDHIKVGGKLLRFSAQRIYLVLNKPAGCVATMSDPEGRQSLLDFLHSVPGRVFPAGRLDFHTEGLLLLTNDGELVNRLLKVSGHLEQVYWIKMKGALSGAELQAVQKRVGARLAPMAGRGEAANPWYEATVTEARSDALRQTLSQMGHHVEKLRRVKLAELELGRIEAGEYRLLTESEVAGLMSAVALATARNAATAPVPAPYAGKEVRAARGREPRRPGGTPGRPAFRRGARPGGARPSRPPEFPKKRWSRPSEATSATASGPGGKRPFSPRPFPKKQWSRPGGAPSAPASGPSGRPGGARPYGPPRKFSGKPSGKPWGKPGGEKPKWKGKGEPGPRHHFGKGGKGAGKRSGKPHESKGTNRE